MPIHYFPRDGEPESGAIAWRPGDAIEALEHLAALALGNARSGVLDAQEWKLLPIAAGIHRDRSTSRRIAQSIVDQVIEQLGQEHRVAPNGRAFEREAEIDLARKRLGGPVPRGRVGKRAQVNDLLLAPLIRRILGPGQHEQLVGETTRTYGGIQQPLELATN